MLDVAKTLVALEAKQDGFSANELARREVLSTLDRS
jgi:hypothetical protein